MRNITENDYLDPEGLFLGDSLPDPLGLEPDSTSDRNNSSS